jgi:hypothetical protein
MKKDITFHKVDDVGIAIIPEEHEGEKEWMAYLINTGPNVLEGVIVCSNGYGNINGQDIKTSTLRQFFEKVPAGHAVKLELVEEKVFSLNNEFWISFWLNGQMCERKVVFLPESISENYFTMVPILEKRGVLIL